MAKVEFFDGTSLIATATTAPYRFNWSDVPFGNCR
ncbi:Ig-like domain-containing protein [Undibacterium sp. CY18W]|uniref:Ig-like domain-containing protein n=1 Tax=Undibacterium hunanense TaxID=2762292 RepID=A0ABR6ZUE5_9BURK|nr:Ig-like domain-containing protein [Undibacterium hunanense]